MHSPPDVPKLLRGALIKTLLLPVLVLIFFSCASPWYASRVHDVLRRQVNASRHLSFVEKLQRTTYVDSLDIQTICSNPTLRLELLHQEFEKAGICGTFDHLFWGWVCAVILVVILAAALGAIVAFNAQARKSPQALVQNYEAAWKVTMAAAIAKLVLLVPLLSYGSYEFMVLVSGRYLGQILAVILVSGLAALVTCLTVLLQRVPPEFAEPMSRDLTPEEAPEMWQVVRQAAEHLGTAPPDRIVVGVKQNFYVTELAVQSDTCRAPGRTLFLSYPLLRQLSEDEVVAVIGHELGHFRGEDTRMTRRFHPLKLKVSRTCLALARNGLVGWPSMGLLSFFTLSFERTLQTSSRARELLADEAGASLSSGQALGRALIKLQVFNEALPRLLADPTVNAGNPMEINWQLFIANQLPAKDPFWFQLFNKKLPHVLDSHPPLHTRLEALGFEAGAIEARAVALHKSSSAYDAWFATRGEVFKILAKQAGAVLGAAQAQVQVRQADYKTASGKQLLDDRFPEIRWRLKSFEPWCWMTLSTLLGLASAGGAVGMLLNGKPWITWVLTAALAGLCAAVVLYHWKYREGELILNAESLSHTAAGKRLLFAEAETMFWLRRKGRVLLFFNLKKPRPRQGWQVRPIRQVAFFLRGFEGNPDEMAKAIQRYFSRQLPAPPQPAVS